MDILATEVSARKFCPRKILKLDVLVITLNLGGLLGFCVWMHVRMHAFLMPYSGLVVYIFTVNIRIEIQIFSLQNISFICL